MKKKIKNETPLERAVSWLHPEEIAEINRLWVVWKNELEVDTTFTRTRSGNFQGLFEIGIRMDLKWARKVLATEPYYGARLIVAAAYDKNRE